MTEYREITSQADIDALCGNVVGFHDSIAREFRLINRAHVLPDRSLTGPFRYDGQLLIQSQWPPFAVEMAFCNILELRTTTSKEIWSGNGRFLNVGREVDTAVEFNFDGSLMIKAERVFYAYRSDWLGKRTFLGPELPSPDAIRATKIDGKWRQCSACSDAWEEDDAIRFCLCPSCGMLTDLLMQ